jgi:hypothetical protein
VQYSHNYHVFREICYYQCVDIRTKSAFVVSGGLFLVRSHNSYSISPNCRCLAWECQDNTLVVQVFPNSHHYTMSRQPIEQLREIVQFRFSVLYTRNSVCLYVRKVYSTESTLLCMKCAGSKAPCVCTCKKQFIGSILGPLLTKQSGQVMFSTKQNITVERRKPYRSARLAKSPRFKGLHSFSVFYVITER